MRAYKLNLRNGKENLALTLRFDVDALKTLKDKKYKVANTEELTNSIIASVADFADVADNLGYALRHRNNTNDITDGNELYDILIDNGYDVDSIGRIVVETLHDSGMLNENYYKVIMAQINATEVQNEEVVKEELERLQKAAEGEEKNAETPEN